MSARPSEVRTEAPRYALPILLVLVTIAFFALILGFYKAIVWAFVFALLSRPVYVAVRRRLGGRDMAAAGLTTLLVVLVVLIPAVAFGLVLANQAADVAQGIQDGDIDPAAPVQFVTGLTPRLEDTLEAIGLDLGNLTSRASEAFASGGQFLASQALEIGQGALKTTLLLALTIYLLFFFLLDGRRILHFIYEAFPIQGPGERYLFKEIGRVTQATVKGILVIGLVQGTMGGITFALLGIPNAVLWGVAMAISTILPVVGTAIVWLPAAIVLFAGGFWVKGVLMLIAGTVFIGLVDNLLRPRVVGRDTKIPDYIVLLATLGGLGAFGLTGLVLGPVIAGIFLACWRMYRPELLESSAESVD
jgi:predicted PurR-regulated permease PerM